MLDACRVQVIDGRALTMHAPRQTAQSLVCHLSWSTLLFCERENTALACVRKKNGRTEKLYCDRWVNWLEMMVHDRIRHKREKKNRNKKMGTKK
jgi:hypothetical protein